MSQEQISTSLWLAWTSGPFYKSLSLRLGAIPHSNSGKRTLANTATKLFNDLSSDLKEFSISSSPLILKFLPSLLSLNYEVCFSHAYHRPSIWRMYCARLVAILFIVTVFHIVLLQPLLRLLIYIYICMYTCSFIVHILPAFVDLYIIHYVFIA